MSTQQKQALKWLVQGLIVVALVFFILFVFYGPTGDGTETDDSLLKSEVSNHSIQLSVPGDSNPFLKRNT